VGATGKAYGLDIADEMLDLARLNQSRAGVGNVEFLNGHMEAIPLPAASVDVALSNCVIALSVDKAAVFAEAFRVLRPGGRLALADVIAENDTESAGAVDPSSWVDCVSGALSAPRYREALAAAGFTEVSIQRSHAVSAGLASVLVRAARPGAAGPPTTKPVGVGDNRQRRQGHARRRQHGAPWSEGPPTRPGRGPTSKPNCTAAWGTWSAWPDGAAP